MLIGIGRATESVLNLLQVRIYSELLSVAEVGRLSLILAITTFFTQLFGSPMGSFIARNTLEWVHEKDRLPRELLNYAAYLIAVVPVAAITLLLINPYLVMTPRLGYWPMLLLIAGNLVILNLQQNFVTLINILGDPKWFVVLSNAALCLAITLSVVFVTQLGPTAERWQSGYLLGYALVIPVSFYLVRIRQPRPYPSHAPRPAGILSKGALSFVVPLAVGSIAFWVQGYGYRMVIAANSNESALGIFTLGLTLGFAPMALITKVTNDYLSPGFYTRIARQPQARLIEAWQAFSARYISVALLAAPLIAAGGPFLARLLLASSYWNYAWLSYFGAGFQMLLMTYASYVMLAQALRANSLIVAPNIVTSLAIVGGIALLSRWQPLVGSGIGLLLGGLVLNIMTAWRFHSRYDLKVPWGLCGKALLGGVIGAGLITFACRLLPHPSSITSAIVILAIGAYFVAWTVMLLMQPPSAPTITPEVSSG